MLTNKNPKRMIKLIYMYTGMCIYMHRCMHICILIKGVQYEKRIYYKIFQPKPFFEVVVSGNIFSCLNVFFHNAETYLRQSCQICVKEIISKALQVECRTIWFDVGAYNYKISLTFNIFGIKNVAVLLYHAEHFLLKVCRVKK